MEQVYAFLDIETTGLNPQSDNIIEIGAVIASNGIITDRFSSLVRTDGSLPLKIKNLTGIKSEMLQDAPELQEIAGNLLAFLGDKPIIGHNISFDIGFINAKIGAKITNPLIDTLDFLRFLLPTAVNYRLETVKNILGLANIGFHRALDDAESACQVFFKCIEIINNLNSEVQNRIYQLCDGQEWALSRYINYYISENFKKFPSVKSVLPYAFLSRFESTEDELFDNYEKEPRSHNNIELSSLNSYLGPTGPFADNNPQYKYRPGQVEMLQTVIEGFTKARHMVIEAGTGTGKSLAYLIPAVGWALSQETKVVIATHTINLQEQLWNKEIPDIKQRTELDFSTALVKGRKNYLCLRRWDEKIKENTATEQSEVLFCLKVLIWLTETEHGDKSEINFSAINSRYWSEISSDIDTCLGLACPWFHKHCFLTKARRKAEIADILVVNHSLLLADIKMQNRVLPAYNYLIVDEAHHLEESATEQLGWTIGLQGLRMALLSLNRGFGTGFSPGLLNQLKKLFRNNSKLFSQPDLERLDELLNQSFEKVKAIVESIDEMNNHLKAWSSDQLPENDDDNYVSVRVRQSQRVGATWAALLAVKDNFINRTLALIQLLKKVSGLIETIDYEKKREFLTITKDIEYQLNYLVEINTNLNDFSLGLEEHVYWLEVNNGINSDLKIRSAPVSVSQILYDSLFQTKKSVLLTSATLSVDGKFDHFMQRTGLSLISPGGVVERSLDSPFIYEKQTLLCVVRDLPDPSKVSESEYVEEVIPLIRDIVRTFEGKTLVLFTSHKMLREAYFRLQSVLGQYDIAVLGHKIDGGRSRLIEDFKINNRTVLLGASSFWEGIDLPGEILKCVIIVRLPFSPPNTPVIEARIEELLNKNIDAFYSYNVPEAVLKMKQGFGRLIRTEEDEGVVVVLDRRIVDRKYGRKFLNSLPAKIHFRGDSATVIQKISDWAGGERSEVPPLNILENIEDINKYLRKVKKRKD